MRKIPKLILFLLAVLPFTVFGAVTLKHVDNKGSLSVSDSQLSYFPRVYLGGYTGSEALGQADVLAPIFLRNNLNLFVYGQARYSYAKETWAKDPWTGAIGLGYRQIVGNAAILGAHVLGDYTESTTNRNFWVVSPGIEVLSRTWDFHANGYFPTGDTDWKTEGWADDFGDYSHISFSGHDQFDAWYIYHQEAGIGTDAELGRKLFTYNHVLVKGFVDGYYFNMKHNEDLYGAGARVTIEPNTYLEFSLDDTYDNYAHNTFMFGIEVSLYDLFQKDKVLNDQDLQRRLFDRIDRNFAELGSGSDTRITGGPPDEEDQKPQQPQWFMHNTPEKENVWFFNGAGISASASNGTTLTYEDGTYEHPFTAADFNQQTVTDIYNLTKADYPNAYLYFNKATYTAYDPAGPTPIELWPGESMWGRMGAFKGFQQPATGNNRPTFIGGLQLDGNTGLDSIILENDFATTGFGIGIDIIGGSNTINNSVIGTNATNTSYVTGIKVDNATLTISDSDIYAKNPTGSSIARGIYLINSNLNLNSNNVISVSSVVGSGGTNLTAYGVFAVLSNITISGNNNQIFAVGSVPGGASNNIFVIGISLSASTLTITGNDNLLSSSLTTAATGISGTGLYSSGISMSVSHVNITGSNNTFKADTYNTVDQTKGQAAGIYVVTAADDTINISGTGNTFLVGTSSPTNRIDNAYGIYLISTFDSNNIAVTGVDFDVKGNSFGYGIFQGGGFPMGMVRTNLLNNNDFTDSDNSIN